MKKLAAGNWKMNGTAAALSEVSALLAAHPAPDCEMLLCPPATLVAQMAALEADLKEAVHEQESRVFFQIKGKRVEFEGSIRETHRKLKRSLWRWIVTDRPQNFLTGPIIYSLIVPLAVLDLCVTFYQASCFPIYKIAKVRRADYIALDRQHLEDLMDLLQMKRGVQMHHRRLVRYQEIAVRWRLKRHSYFRQSPLQMSRSQYQ